jgi:hypothetical protein
MIEKRAFARPARSSVQILLSSGPRCHNVAIIAQKRDSISLQGDVARDRTKPAMPHIVRRSGMYSATWLYSSVGVVDQTSPILGVRFSSGCVNRQLLPRKNPAGRQFLRAVGNQR